MTTQDSTLPTPRKKLDMRRFLDDWVMLLAAFAIFLLCTLLIDNFLSPLNMRGALSVMHWLPASPPRMASKIFRGSTPAFFPRHMASPTIAMLTATMH